MVETRVTAEGQESVLDSTLQTRSEPTFLALIQQHQNPPDEGGERSPPHKHADAAQASWRGQGLDQQAGGQYACQRPWALGDGHRLTRHRL